jgi:hypothetical protein
LEYSSRSKKIFTGTDQNNVLCFPIDDILEKNLSEFSFDAGEDMRTSFSPRRMRSKSPQKEDSKNYGFDYVSDDSDVEEISPQKSMKTKSITFKE